MDAATHGDVDGRWMTHAELAELRRIDKPSALKLAIRHKWPRWWITMDGCRYASRPNGRSRGAQPQTEAWTRECICPPL
jgi:hypothetical protein